MCESTAFIERNGGEELLLSEVVRIEPVSGGYRLIGLLGDEVTLRGELREIDLLHHKILFTEDE